MAQGYTLLRIVEDAAGQSDFLELDRIDTEAPYYDVYFGVDSNIFDLFIDPFGRAAASEGRALGYGEVFRDDDSTRKGAIGAALGRFIWEDLAQPTRPLLLVPPIDVEVALLEGAAQRFLEKAYLNVEKLKGIIREFTDTVRERKPEAAKVHALQLHSMIIEAYKARRFFELLERERFLSIDKLNRYDQRFPEAFTNTVQPWHDVFDMIEFAQKREAWIERLRGMGRHLDIRLERDAEAFARIQMWNERLRSTGSRCRFVYITGDNSLLAAASEVKLSGDRHAPDHHRLRHEHTFRDAYVRHPRCLLDRPGVVRSAGSPGDTSSSLYDWLSLLLGDFEELAKPLGTWSRSHFVLAAEVVAQIDEVQAANPNVANEIGRAWAEFSETLELRAFVDADPVRTLQDLRPLPEADVAEFTRTLTVLLGDVEQEVMEAWQACVRAFTEVRFIVDVLMTPTAPIRRPPPVILEGSAPEAFIKAADGWIRRRSSFDADTFEKLKRDLDREDPSGYNFLVGVARILAQGQHWPSAAFLCTHARVLADREVKEHGLRECGTNGREARFLEAFCRRHNARQLADLDALDDLLERGLEIATMEQAQWAQIDTLKERFLVEQIALSITRLFFRWYKNSDILPVELDQATKNIQDCLKLLEEQANDPCRFDKRESLLLLKQRLDVNALTLGIVFSERADLQIMAKQSFENLCEEFDSRNHPDRSEYISLLLQIGRAIFGEAAGRTAARRDARKQIDGWLSSIASNRLNSFPYESARLRAFSARLGREA